MAAMCGGSGRRRGGERYGSILLSLFFYASFVYPSPPLSPGSINFFWPRNPRHPLPPHLTRHHQQRKRGFFSSGRTRENQKSEEGKRMKRLLLLLLLLLLDRPNEASILSPLLATFFLFGVCLSINVVSTPPPPSERSVLSSRVSTHRTLFYWLVASAGRQKNK